MYFREIYSKYVLNPGPTSWLSVPDWDRLCLHLIQVSTVALFRLTLSVGLVLTLGFSGVAMAASPDLSGKDPHWIQDAANLCWAANPDPKPGENIIWNGECKNGLLDGPGTLSWYVNGRLVSRDSGTYLRGELSGHGRIVFPSGVIFDGDFPGNGVFTTPNGRKIAAHSIKEGAGWSIHEDRPDAEK